MFESFSDRARIIIFQTRRRAGERGASAIGVEDLIDALMVEDQDSRAFSPGSARGTSVRPMPKHEAYFTAESAAMIRRGLEPLLPSQGKRLAISVDMSLSEKLQELLQAAIELRMELRDAMPPLAPTMYVEPLHLLAAALSDTTSAVSEVLRQAGVEREAVIAAIRGGAYSS